MNTTSIENETPRAQMPVVLGMLLSLPIFGFQVGTGGAATLDYLKNRGDKGYAFADYDLKHQSANLSEANSVTNLKRIRLVFQQNVTSLAKVFGVSRQAIYDWQAGRPIAAENVDRIDDLARAADLFVQERLQDIPHILRRSIVDGKNLLEVFKDGGPAETTARTLIAILQREHEQREILRERLGTRAQTTREDFSDLGTPMLNELG